MRIRQDSPRIVTIPVLNPPPSTTIMTIHPDGSVEGGPPRESIPSWNKFYCAPYKDKANRLKEDVPLKPPSLEEIHLAGRGEGPEIVLPQFAEFQVLSTDQKQFLLQLWKSYDYLADLNIKPRWKTREYLNPSDPLRLGQVAASRLEALGADRKSLIILHHKIRKSLAGEKVMVLDVPPATIKPVRYRLVANGTPVRQGTLAVLRPPLEEAIQIVQKTLGLDPSTQNIPFKELLVPLELIRLSRQEERSKSPLTVSRRLDRMDPSLTEEMRDRVIVTMSLAEMIRLKVSGDHFFQNLMEKANYRNLIELAEQGLRVPQGTLFRVLAKKSGEGLFPYRGRFSCLPQILSLLNLLKIQKPSFILYGVYQEALEWAFTIKKQGGVPVLFRTEAIIDEEKIRQGLPGILSRARLERDWNLQQFSNAISAHLGRAIDSSTIGNICMGKSSPDFDVLRAIVEACNKVQGVTALDPATCFLAWMPTFYRLLPLFSQQSKKSYSKPSPGPFETVGLTAHRTNGVFKVYSKDGERVPLDPKGLPALLRKGRISRGETTSLVARRLGIHHVHYKKIETGEPLGAESTSRPGRIFMSMVVSPKGLSITPEEAFEAHWHSYWRDHPVIEKLRARSFMEVFIDPQMMRRFENYANYDFRTPGEILYTLRNGSRGAIRDAGLPWLPSDENFVKALKMSFHRYQALEANETAPTERELLRLQSLFQANREEIEEWRQAAHALNRHLDQKRPAFPQDRVWHYLESTKHLYDLVVRRPFVTKDDAEHFLQKLIMIEDQDPESLVVITKLSSQISDPDSESLGRIIQLVHEVEGRLRTWPKNVSRKGPLAAVYCYNKKKVRPLANALMRGKIASLRISPINGSYEITRRAKPRQVKTALTINQSVLFPGPHNQWCESDFTLSLGEIRERMIQFFKSLEQRIGMRPNEIQRACRFPDYNKIRIARLPLSPYLVPSVLKMLHLSKQHVAEIRHLETLLALARDRESQVERGPYWQQGFLIRYFRILHDVPLSEVRAVYQGENAIEGYSAVELGRVCGLNQETLTRLARALRVPVPLESAFVDHLIDSYLRLQSEMTRGAHSAVVDHFPNSEWSIPHQAANVTELVERLRTRTLTDREEKIIGAVIKLRSSAMSDRAGYFQAGRLIRFARYIAPDLTHEKILEKLGSGLSLSTYTQWEWGLLAMPNVMIDRFAQLLEATKTLIYDDAISFGEKLKSLYTTCQKIGGLR